MLISIDDRMKELEFSTRVYLLKRCYTLIRIDGKCFHSFAKNANKPFDIALITAMQETTKYLCANIQGCKLGYTQSDEITLVLTDFDSLTSEAWFGGNIQKIVSISASMATAKFNTFKFHFTEGVACFDSRVWPIADPWEVYNSFLWRQQDATKNAMQMAARQYFSHAELQNKKFDELNEMLFSIGINFNDYPTVCKRGTFVIKTDNGWLCDTDSPILTQDKNYFFSRLPLIPQPVW